MKLINFFSIPENLVNDLKQVLCFKNKLLLHSIVKPKLNTSNSYFNYYRANIMGGKRTIWFFGYENYR